MQATVAGKAVSEQFETLSRTTLKVGGPPAG